MGDVNLVLFEKTGVRDKKNIGPTLLALFDFRYFPKRSIGRIGVASNPVKGFRRVGKDAPLCNDLYYRIKPPGIFEEVLNPKNLNRLSPRGIF